MFDRDTAVYISLYSIVDPNTGLGIEKNKKYNTVSVGVFKLTGHGTCPRRQAVTVKISSQILHFTTLQTTLSQHLLIFLSIFDPWGHMLDMKIQ